MINPIPKNYQTIDNKLDKFNSDEGTLIETNVKIDKDKAYIISLGNNNKILDLTPFLQQKLEAKYKKKIEQINILPHRAGNSKYIVNNGILKKMIIEGKADLNSKIYIPVEKMNKEVSENQHILNLISEIKNNQGDVLINVYKNSPELDIHKKIDSVSILAPDPYLVQHYDDKTIQRDEVAKNLGLPLPRHYNAESIDELIKIHDNHFNGNAFIMLKNSSCGEGAEIINSKKDILQSPKLKDPMKCSIMDFIDVKLSPATLGIIAGDGIYIAGFADQILEGPKFLGSISPSISEKKAQKEIFEITREIGNYMKNKGYRGPFGVDFMIDTSGKVYFAEINPRVIGSTPEFSKAHSIVNPHTPSIPEIIYNSIMEDKLGFNPEKAELPQLPWARRLLAVKEGHITKPLPISSDFHIQIKEYPYANTKFLTKNTLARIIYSGNPHASREHILNSIFNEEKRIMSL